MLWNNSYNDSPFNPGTNCADDGKYFCVFENAIVRGIDALTGKTLWETKTDYPWGEFWTYNVASGPIDPKNPDAKAYSSQTATLAPTHLTGTQEQYSGAVLMWLHRSKLHTTSMAQRTVYPGTGTPIIADGIVYVQV